MNRTRAQVLTLILVLSSGLGRVSPAQMSVAREDGTSTHDDATDEIMDRLVKSVTQNPSDRPSSPKTRKRSRVNRKSCEYTFCLVGGVSNWNSDGTELVGVDELQSDWSIVHVIFVNKLRSNFSLCHTVKRSVRV